MSAYNIDGLWVRGRWEGAGVFGRREMISCKEIPENYP